jgi:hypothetical protein
MPFSVDTFISRLQRFQYSSTFTQGAALGFYISRLWR